MNTEEALHQLREIAIISKLINDMIREATERPQMLEYQYTNMNQLKKSQSNLFMTAESLSEAIRKGFLLQRVDND